MNEQLDAVKSALNEAKQSLDNLLANKRAQENIVEAANLMIFSLRQGGKVLSCGNGGSLCDSMHFAEELSGRFRLDRDPIGAISMADPSHMSCVGNDYGYEEVFSRYLRAVGRKGDVLLAITTSGTSKNVVKAARAAKEIGVKVVALTGKPGTPVCDLADVAVVTPGGRYADRVQELHIKVIHILIELIESGLKAPINELS